MVPAAAPVPSPGRPRNSHAIVGVRIDELGVKGAGCRLEADATIRLCVDMQRLFAEETTWQVASLNTVFTRFAPPAPLVGQAAV